MFRSRLSQKTFTGFFLAALFVFGGIFFPPTRVSANAITDLVDLIINMPSENNTQYEGVLAWCKWAAAVNKNPVCDLIDPDHAMTKYKNVPAGECDRQKNPCCTATLDFESDNQDCIDILLFDSQTEAGKSTLCAKWQSDPATMTRSKLAYNKTQCSSRALEVTFNYVQATKMACQQYTNKIPISGSTDISLCDPTCGASSPTCRCVKLSDCNNLGAGLGSAGALASGMDLSTGARGDAALARIQKVLDTAKTQKLSGTIIASIEKYLKLGQDANAELKKTLITNGQSAASLAPLNDLAKKIEGYADAAEKLIQIPVETGSSTVLNNPLGNTSILGVLGNVIKVFLGTVGAISLAVFVYAGLMYLLSAGDPAMVTKAKDTMKYGAFGLILIMGAYALTTFFIKTLSL